MDFKLLVSRYAPGYITRTIVGDNPRTDLASLANIIALRARPSWVKTTSVTQYGETLKFITELALELEDRRAAEDILVRYRIADKGPLSRPIPKGIKIELASSPERGGTPGAFSSDVADVFTALFFAYIGALSPSAITVRVVREDRILAGSPEVEAHVVAASLAPALLNALTIIEGAGVKQGVVERAPTTVAALRDALQIWRATFAAALRSAALRLEALRIVCGELYRDHHKMVGHRRYSALPHWDELSQYPQLVSIGATEGVQVHMPESTMAEYLTQVHTAINAPGTPWEVITSDTFTKRYGFISVRDATGNYPVATVVHVATPPTEHGDPLTILRIQDIDEPASGLSQVYATPLVSAQNAVGAHLLTFADVLSHSALYMHMVMGAIRKDVRTTSPEKQAHTFIASQVSAPELAYIARHFAAAVDIGEGRQEELALALPDNMRYVGLPPWAAGAGVLDSRGILHSRSPEPIIVAADLTVPPGTDAADAQPRINHPMRLVVSTRLNEVDGKRVPNGVATLRRLPKEAEFKFLNYIDDPKGKEVSVKLPLHLIIPEIGTPHHVSVLPNLRLSKRIASALEIVRTAMAVFPEAIDDQGFKQLAVSLLMASLHPMAIRAIAFMAEEAGIASLGVYSDARAATMLSAAAVLQKFMLERTTAVAEFAPDWSDTVDKIMEQAPTSMRTYIAMQLIGIPAVQVDQSTPFTGTHGKLISSSRKATI